MAQPCEEDSQWLYVEPQEEADSGAEFSVGCWNMLAQALVRRSIFHYASKRALKWSHRKGLTERVLASMECDIICLQEVDNFEEHWQEVMSQLGYDSIYHKGERKRHGLAIFYRASACELVAQSTVNLDELAQNTEGVEQEEMTVGNIALMGAFRLRVSGHVVAVATTHLFWNWRYRWTRVAQLLLVLQRLQEFRVLQGPDTFAILAGDLNGGPDSTNYRLATSKQFQLDPERLQTPPDHYDPYVHHVNGPPPEASTDDEPYQTVITDYGDEHRERRVAAVARAQEVRSELPVCRSVYANYTSIDPAMRELLAPCPVHGVVEGTGVRSAEESHGPNGPDAQAEILQSNVEEGCTCAATPARAELLTQHDTGVVVGGKTKWTGEPPFTVYGPAFRATLDYIFTLESDNGRELTVRALRRLMTPIETTVQVGLPNDHHPSDHLPLACRFGIP